MRKIILAGSAVGLFTANAWAVDLNPDQAWVGGTNMNPVNFTPQELATAGHQLTGTEREKLYDNDGDWYQWNEPSDKDYDWVMTRYDDPDPNLAICRWEVAIDHDNNSVHIFYWHSPNGNWVWLEANAGGRNPGVEYTDVTDAFTYDTGDDPHAILLFVGNTPDPSENWIKADVTDISYR